MIKFSLACDNGHGFEAWFKNGDDYESQRKRGFLECPTCGSNHVSKGLMAPSISGAKRQEEVNVAISDDTRREILSKMQEIARVVRRDGENVGSRFAEEARKIHYGESGPRGIYGKATPDEVTNLIEEGVSIMPLPNLPEDMN